MLKKRKSRAQALTKQHKETKMEPQIVSKDVDVLVECLRSLGAGMLLSQTANNLKEAISAVKATGKAASVSIKLNIKPDTNSEGEIIVFGTTGVNLPKEPIRARFYVSESLLPVRNAPNQLVMSM